MGPYDFMGSCYWLFVGGGRRECRHGALGGEVTGVGDEVLGVGGGTEVQGRGELGGELPPGGGGWGGVGDVRQEGVGVAVIGDQSPGGPEGVVDFAGVFLDQSANMEEGGGHAFGGLEAGGVEGGAEDLADAVEDGEGGGDDGEGAFVSQFKSNRG